MQHIRVPRLRLAQSGRAIGIGGTIIYLLSQECDYIRNRDQKNETFPCRPLRIARVRVYSFFGVLLYLVSLVSGV